MTSLRCRLSSCGFWPGNGGYGCAASYVYAYPGPAGYGDTRLSTAGAFYDKGLGQFILPYDAVRTVGRPRQAPAWIFAGNLRSCGGSGEMGSQVAGAGSNTNPLNVARVMLLEEERCHERARRPRSCDQGGSMPSSGSARSHASTRRRAALDGALSALGLGCVKSPAPSERVEEPRKNCASQSSIIMPANSARYRVGELYFLPSADLCVFTQPGS